MWYPALLDRTSVGTERTELYDRARGRVDEILENHEPAVDSEVCKEIEAYVQGLLTNPTK